MSSALCETQMYRFSMLAIYVDGVNIFYHKEMNLAAAETLQATFEMTSLETHFCIGQRIEWTLRRLFIHQTTHARCVLKHFSMSQVHLLSTPMVVRYLGVHTNPFRPTDNDEDILGPETPYLTAIGALMYLAINAPPNITFADPLQPYNTHYLLDPHQSRSQIVSYEVCKSELPLWPHR